MTHGIVYLSVARIGLSDAHFTEAT